MALAGTKTKPNQYTEKIRAFFGSESSLREFEALSNNGDRIEFLFRHPFVAKLFKKNALDIKNEGRPHGKSICESKRQRELGNQAFKAGNDEKALRFYNEAMAYAPWRGGESAEIIKGPHMGATKPSDEFAFSVANRSAALFRLQRYSETLVDVDLALAAHHPKPEKLVERKVRCLIALDAPWLDIQDASHSQNIKEETLRLWQEEFMKALQLRSLSSKSQAKNEVPSDPTHIRREASLPVIKETNPKIPAFCNAVEVAYRPERGRFGVASRDISFGEVLLVEEPTAVVLKDQELLDHCENCFRFCGALQIPCLFCTRSRFCSTECQEAAWKTFHKFECRNTGMLQTILRQIRGEASDYANLALRAVTQKHLSFFVENAPNWLHKENEMLGLMAAQDPDVAAFLPNHYKSMVSLVKHRQDRTPGSLFWILVTSCLNLRQLQLAGYFNQGDVESPRPIELNPTNVKTKLTSDMKLIGQVLVEFLELMQYNTHGILESFGIAADDQVLFSNPLQDRVPKRQNRSFGAGVFPTLALLNHSCGHNIFKYNIGKKIVVLAGRNIRQGEEITENYFPHHYYMSQIDRQIWLQEHYNFRCECKACIEDWPTLGVLMDFRLWAFPLRGHESSKERSKAAEEEIKYIMDQVDQIRQSFLAQNSCLLISEAERLILKFREGFKVLDRHIRYPSKEHTQASETFISLLTSIRGNRRELFSTSF